MPREISRSRKAQGPVKINVELFNSRSTKFKMWLLFFYNSCWKLGSVPHTWSEFLIVPIFMRGKWQDCDNCRCISSLNSGYEVFVKIVVHRLKCIAGVKQGEEQHVFHRVRSYTVCVFELGQLIKKHCEFNIPTFVDFVNHA